MSCSLNIEEIQTVSIILSEQGHLVLDGLFQTFCQKCKKYQN